MTPLSRQHAWFALFVLVVFVAGLATGVTVARYVRPDPRGPGRPGPFAPGRPPAPADIARRLTRELGLDAGQQARVQAVLDEAGPRLEQFRAKSMREFDALRDQMNAEIEQVLTPEQRTAFRAMTPERRGGLRPPGPPDQPPPGPPIQPPDPPSR